MEEGNSGKQSPAIRYLPEDYEPSPHDVLCGRGRRCYCHSGNVTFRDIVQSKLAKYSAASTKMEKGAIISEVYDEICEQAGIGGFIKKDEQNRWYDVGEFLAREKVSQAFRDALQDKYKSSTASKKKRRELLIQGAEMHSQRSLVSGHSQRSLFSSASQRSLCSGDPTLDELERIAMQSVRAPTASNNKLMDLLDGELRQAFGTPASRWNGYTNTSFRGVDEMPVYNRRQEMMQAYAKPVPGNYEVNKSCPILAWQGGRSLQACDNMDDSLEPLDYNMEGSGPVDYDLRGVFVEE